MARLPSPNEPIKGEEFVQQKTIAMYFGMSHYDRVLKVNSEGVAVPAIHNNNHAKTNCDDFKRCLKNYGVNDPKDIYDLSFDPTKAATIEVFSKIMNRLTEGRDSPIKVNYLVIFFFVGHGLL